MFYIFPQAIRKEDCEHIISECLVNLEDQFQEAVIDKEAIIDPSFRKTDVAFLNNSSPIQTNKISLFDNHPEHKNWYFEGDNKINKLVYSYVMEANKLFFNYNIDYFEPLQFARYQKDYFYDWHQDFLLDPNNHESRKLSLSLSLSDRDTYEGGYLEFFNGRNIDNKYGGYTEIVVNGTKLTKAETREQASLQGSVVVFDSRDWHRVTPIIKGTRYSLTCWTVGPNLR
ncbi:MAG: hypothetical protein CL464_10895 [Acidimicrobiaceae bacterium]|nr:hypothetical protein [Acidimicrobiaceae bacterium]|tara:strand:+ start:3439 stop:4122 length:684 start_codon:yes stop_codon:yes gene_type:complete